MNNFPMDKQKLTLGPCLDENHVQSLSKSQIKALTLNEPDLRRGKSLSNNYEFQLLRSSKIELK